MRAGPFFLFGFCSKPILLTLVLLIVTISADDVSHNDPMGILNPKLFVDFASDEIGHSHDNYRLKRNTSNSTETAAQPQPGNNANNVEGLLANCQLTNLYLYQALQQQRAQSLLGLGGFLGNLGGNPPFPPAAAINQNLLFPLAETLHTYTTTSNMIETLTTVISHTIPLLFGNKASTTTITRTKTYEITTNKVLTLTSTIRPTLPIAQQIIPTQTQSFAPDTMFASSIMPTNLKVRNIPENEPYEGEINQVPMQPAYEKSIPDSLERRSEQQTIAKPNKNQKNHREKYIIEPELDNSKSQEIFVEKQQEPTKPSLNSRFSAFKDRSRPTFFTTPSPQPITSAIETKPTQPGRKRRKNRNKEKKRQQQQQPQVEPQYEQFHRSTIETPKVIQQQKPEPEVDDYYPQSYGNYGGDYGNYAPQTFSRPRQQPQQQQQPNYANDYYTTGTGAEDTGAYGGDYGGRYYQRRQKREKLGENSFQKRSNDQSIRLEPSFQDQMSEDLFSESSIDQPVYEKCPEIDQNKVRTVTVTKIETKTVMKFVNEPSSTGSIQSSSSTSNSNLENERRFRTISSRRFYPGRHYHK